MLYMYFSLVLVTVSLHIIQDKAQITIPLVAMWYMYLSLVLVTVSLLIIQDKALTYNSIGCNVVYVFIIGSGCGGAE